MATLTKYPTANTPTTGFNGVANSPTAAYTDNATYANFAPSKPRNDEDAHSWGGFDFSAIPAGSTINSVTVKVQVYCSASNTASNAEWRVALFEDVTAATALAPGVTGAIGATQYTRGFTDTSEYEWDLGTLSTEPTLAQLQATNFGVRIEASHGNTGTSYTYYVDTIEITVDYTAPVTAPDFDLTGFRFRDDSVALNTDTWTYALNTDPTVDVYSGDVTLRLRVLLENTDTVTAMPSTGDYQLQYNVNGGTWYAIGAGTGIDTGVSSNFATGDATTQLLGSGSFATGEAVESGSDATDRACGTETEIEHEWVFDLASAELSNNDLIDFRVVWRETTESWNVISTPTHTPEITVTKVAPAATQRWFCFYNDSLENAGDTARHGAVNRGKALADDTVYLLRMGMSASGALSVTPKLQYRVRTEAALGWTSWADVNATSSYVRSAATANIADDAQTTEQLDDSGTFTAGRFDEVDGAITTATSLTATTDTEFLFAIKARSAELSWRNIVQLRMVNASDGAAYGTYDLYPTLSLAGSIAEDFEDGTDLTLIAALDEGTPNSVFDSIQQGDGFSFIDDPTPPHGSLEAFGDGTAAGAAEWRDVLCPELFVRMYVYKAATPTANTGIARFYDSGDTGRNAIRWLPDGTLNIQENDSTNHSAGSPSTGQWIRVEARWVAAASADHTDSILELKYWDTDADSTGTPDGTVTVDPALGAAELGQFWLRWEGGEVWFFDEVSIANDDWIGPAGGTAHTESETEAVGVTDSTARVHDAERSETEAVGVTDSTSRVHDAARTVTDPVGVTDAVAAAKTIQVTITEAVGATDTVASAITKSAVITEAVGVQDDSTAHSHQRARTVTDAVGVTDATAPAKAIAATVTDPVGVTDDTDDVLSGGTDYQRTSTDPVGVTDATTRVASAVRAVTEAVGIEDATTAAKTITVTITEAVGVEDAVARVAPAARTVTDPVGISDAVSDDENNRESLVEAVGVTDAVGRVHDAERTITDPAGVTDQTLPAKAITVTIADAVGVTDVPATTQTVLRAITEAVGATDTTSRDHDAERTITDAVGVTDNTAEEVTGEGQEVSTEAVGVTDAISRIHDAERTVTDAAGVTDATLPAKAITVTITEAVGVTDATTRQRDNAATVTEAVGVTDTATTAKTITATVTDPVGIEDATTEDKTGGGAIDRTATDPVGVTDAVARVAPAARPIPETVGVTDTVETAHAIVVVITEAVGVTDATSPAKATAATITENVGAADVTLTTRVHGRTITEDVGATDDVSRIHPTAWVVTDLVGVTDTVTTRFLGAEYWKPGPPPWAPGPPPWSKAAVPFDPHLPEESPPTW